MSTRRGVALLIAYVSSFYLGLSAALAVIPGLHLPHPLALTTSPVPGIALALIGITVAAQFGATIAWVRSPGLSRRVILAVATLEILLGGWIFWMAPLLHGGGAAPQPGEEPIYGMPAWALWGLLGAFAVGVLMIVAVVIHGPNRRTLSDT